LGKIHCRKYSCENNSLQKFFIVAGIWQKFLQWNFLPLNFSSSSWVPFHQFQWDMKSLHIKMEVCERNGCMCYTISGIPSLCQKYFSCNIFRQTSRATRVYKFLWLVTCIVTYMHNWLCKCCRLNMQISSDCPLPQEEYIQLVTMLIHRMLRFAESAGSTQTCIKWTQCTYWQSC